jgi:hypothetical protein
MTVPTQEAMHTPGPWIVNGLTRTNMWRIDDCGENSKVGLEMLMNPLALVKERADAELIANLPALLESHKQLVEAAKSAHLLLARLIEGCEKGSNVQAVYYYDDAKMADFSITRALAKAKEIKS